MKVEILKKFWKNKRILIIGHTGFTGSWLAIFLNHLGSFVSGYSLSSEKKHIIFNILQLKKKIKNNCFADINNPPTLFNFLKKDSDILEQGPIQKISKKKQLAAYKHLGFWKAMDTLNDKNYLEDLWSKSKCPWKIW